MPVRVTCPSCKAVHTLAEDVLGKAMRCPQCQQLFRVAAPPKPPVLPEEPLEVLPADAPALPSAAKEGVQAQPGKVPPTPPPLRPAAHPDRSARTRPDERVRPQPQRNAAGGNRTLILVLVGVAAVLLLGCAGVVVGGILYFRTSVAAVTQRGPVVQAEGRAPDAGVRGPMAPFERERPVVPPVNPPVQVVPAKPPSDLKMPPLPPPLPIKPPALAMDPLTYELPAKADALTIGGGGRFLIFRLAKEGKLAVFDVNEARITRELPLAEPNALIAAGMTDLLIALPKANVLQRWNLLTFEREASAPLPFKKTVTGLCIGSASKGPLLVTEEEEHNRVNCRGHFFDIESLKPWDPSWPTVNPPSIVPYLVRASGDGRTFGWRPDAGGEGHGMASLVLRKNGATLKVGSRGDFLFTPGPDGRFIYCISGVIKPDWEQVFPRPAHNNLYEPFIPAVQGPYFLQLISAGLKGPPARQGWGDVVVFQRGPDEEITRFVGLEGVDGMNLGFGNVPDPIVYDQRILFIPAAKLLIQIAPYNLRLILRRLDVEAELEKSGKDYLLVTSEAPPTAKRGEEYAYQMVVKSKRGGVKYRLDSGPPGMAVSPTGRVTWRVPANFAGPEADVILSVADAGQRERVHTFRIALD